MGPDQLLIPDSSSGSARWENARILLRAALVAAALLVAYYAAMPGGKFFYQGF